MYWRTLTLISRNERVLENVWVNEEEKVKTLAKMKENTEKMIPELDRTPGILCGLP